MSIIGSYAPFPLSSQGGYLLPMQEGNDLNYESAVCEFYISARCIFLLYMNLLYKVAQRIFYVHVN